MVFDYHQECRGGNQTNLSKLKAKVGQSLEEFNFFHTDGTNVYSFQTGTIRTNCLDCLDRTNCVQTFLGLEVNGKLTRKQEINYIDNVTGFG